MSVYELFLFKIILHLCLHLENHLPDILEIVKLTLQALQFKSITLQSKALL